MTYVTHRGEKSRETVLVKATIPAWLKQGLPSSCDTSHLPSPHTVSFPRCPEDLPISPTTRFQVGPSPSQQYFHSWMRGGGGWGVGTEGPGNWVEADTGPRHVLLWGGGGGDANEACQVHAAQGRKYLS